MTIHLSTEKHLFNIMRESAFNKIKNITYSLLFKLKNCQEFIHY